MDKIFLHSSVFILIFVRCIAMLFTLPLFSMRSASRIAKIALAGYMSFIIFNTVDFNVYNSYINDDGVFSLYFILLAIGEALIGIILGFYITVIFAAFSTSGQLTAFQMGFMIFIPFLVIDMVVASVLMSMGMMMLPPVMISLPFKILLFILVDGWYLVMKSLLQSF